MGDGWCGADRLIWDMEEASTGRERAREGARRGRRRKRGGGYECEGSRTWDVGKEKHFNREGQGISRKEIFSDSFFKPPHSSISGSARNCRCALPKEYLAKLELIQLHHCIRLLASDGSIHRKRRVYGSAQISAYHLSLVNSLFFIRSSCPTASRRIMLTDSSRYMLLLPQMVRARLVPASTEYRRIRVNLEGH